MGVATQNPWLVHGLDPDLKSARLANYVTVLRKELLALSRACGVDHPARVSLDHFDVLDDRSGTRPARGVFGYLPDWGVPSRVSTCAADRSRAAACAGRTVTRTIAPKCSGW